MELRTLVSDFAEALRRVDAEGPQHTTRKGRTYQPELGPHPEDVAVKLVLQTVKYQELFPMLLNALQRQRQDFQQALQAQAQALQRQQQELIG